MLSGIFLAKIIVIGWCTSKLKRPTSVSFFGGHSVEILNARMTHALRSWQFWFIWEWEHGWNEKDRCHKSNNAKQERRYRASAYLKRQPYSKQEVCSPIPVRSLPVVHPVPKKETVNSWRSVLFCSLAVLDPRVGHTIYVLYPFLSVVCHSDWLFLGTSYPRFDVVHPGRTWSSSPACTWHRSLHYLFFPLFLGDFQSFFTIRFSSKFAAKFL